MLRLLADCRSRPSPLDPDQRLFGRRYKFAHLHRSSPRPDLGGYGGRMANGNRLANESSPYLRQHADNPVDWFAWGSDAFEAAQERDVPILLSVGYSSCHWCHVMAHESFEDGPTATLMNRLFVNVKVDREERPDVDAIYMDATQAMT